MSSKQSDSNTLRCTYLTNPRHIIDGLSRYPYSWIRDLPDDKVRKEGRRNHYTINRRKRLRHPLERQHGIEEFLS
ncbi:MAG: hypothetical protein ABF379_00255 [Akkermansiaceae bacterium]